MEASVINGTSQMCDENVNLRSLLRVAWVSSGNVLIASTKVAGFERELCKLKHKK